MEFDDVVVGAGPNGLTAAAVLARAGRRVAVLEAGSLIGGGASTDEAFGTGIRRDLCSTVHPTGYASPAFADLGLTDRGVTWLVPEISVVHGFSADRAMGLSIDAQQRSVDLGADAGAWERTVGWAGEMPGLIDDVFDLPAPPHQPLALARFAAAAGLPTAALTRLAFGTPDVRGLFAAISAHSSRPLAAFGSAAPGMLLAALAGRGWPVAEGGSQAIAEALGTIVRENGGTIETDCAVTDIGQLPPGVRLYFDTSPAAFATIMGDQLPARYRRRLTRFSHGPGVCKVDFLLSEPIPWRHEVFARTATFHLAEDVGQIAQTESDVAAGRIPARPWILGGEPTRIDPGRAPAGKHLAWAYCHVPAGCGVDVSERIVEQIERCAPGFREVIEAQLVTTATDLAAHNANNVGGDIGGGANTLGQLLRRPVLAPTPQVTPVPGVYLCSAATAPGGGVHGMSGYRAARHSQSSFAAVRS